MWGWGIPEQATGGNLSLHPSWADNEETEGSDVPADYLLGDVEGEEDELYLLDPEHAHSE